MMTNLSYQLSIPFEGLELFHFENRAKRILIVDDDVDLRLLLSELLVTLGFSVSTAKNGRAALDGLKKMEELPRLILLDLHMPEMSGLDFLDAQRKIKDVARIPVIIISSSVFQGPGVRACLEKPLNLLSFLDLVQGIMTCA